MKCASCPLFTSWNNESDRGEACGLFGDAWDSPFQYEDKDGTIIGCYIDRHFIEKTDREYEKHLEVVVAKSKNAITVSSTFTSCISDYTGEEE